MLFFSGGSIYLACHSRFQPITVTDHIITHGSTEKWASVCMPAIQLHYYTVQNQTQEMVQSISGWVLPHKPARTPTWSWQSLLSLSLQKSLDC